MLRVVWSGLFFLFAVVGPIVGAVAMMGMPVAGEIQAAVVGLAIAVAASGVATILSPSFPTIRERDPIPPYFPGK